MVIIVLSSCKSNIRPSRLCFYYPISFCIVCVCFVSPHAKSTRRVYGLGRIGINDQHIKTLNSTVSSAVYIKSFSYSICNSVSHFSVY